MSLNYRKDPATIAELTQEQYRVAQEAATELPFHNEFWDSHDARLYVDVVSGEPLFTSVQKFDSDCGWPSLHDSDRPRQRGGQRGPQLRPGPHRGALRPR